MNAVESNFDYSDVKHSDPPDRPVATESSRNADVENKTVQSTRDKGYWT
jgi:hypothetical protein